MYVFSLHKTSNTSSSLFLSIPSVSHLYIFTTRFGPLLFFLAAHVLWDEDTYGEVPALCAVLVLHQDAVLAGIRCVHAGDGEAGKLARLKLEDAVVVRCDLPVVLQPGDLWHRVTRNVAGEIKSLREGQVTSYVHNIVQSDTADRCLLNRCYPLKLIMCSRASRKGLPCPPGW